MLSTNTLELTVLIAAAILCVDQVSSQTYFASNGPLNSWTEAQAWCNTKQSHLVEIKNDVDQRNLAQFLQSSTLKGYYIALNAERSTDNNWRWISGTSMDSWISVDNQAPTYTNYVNINRTLTSSNGLNFTAELPTSRKGFICQYTDCSNHAGGWSFNGRCFVPVSSPTYGWFDASNYCIRNGGVLAQFDGIQSSTLTNSTLIKNLDPLMAYWIGLIRFIWTWQYFSTSVIYSNWVSGHPSDSNQQCLSMYYNPPDPIDMFWLEVPCQSSMAAICEKNQPPTPSPVTTASPSSSIQPISSTSSNSETTTNTMPSEATKLQPSSTSTTVDDTSTKQTNLALALGVGIGGGVGLIIIIILVVVAAILCTRRRRERKSEDTSPIGVTDPQSIYAQVIPSKDASEPVESSPRNGGKELIYAELASNEEFRPNTTRQTMHPPDILPESFKQRQASVVIADNGDIYSVPHKKSSTSGDGGRSACLTSTTSI